MNRYNKIERIGISKVQSVITEELCWIFREQPLVDVGIDALIEEVRNEEPNGRFIAFQIKSGSSQVYKAGNSYTHYISNIHKNYWLNASLPVVIVVYLDQEDKILWKEVTEKTLLKTERRWKIIFTTDDILSKDSVSSLSALTIRRKDSNILKIVFPKSELDDKEGLNSIPEHIHYLKLMDDATHTINLINQEMNYMGLKMRDYSSQIITLTQAGITPKSSDGLGILNSLAKFLFISSMRLKNEADIFSDLFSTSIWSFGVIIYYNKKLNVDPTGHKKLLDSLEYAAISNQEAIDGYKKLLQSANRLPKLNDNLKIAKKEFVSAVKIMLSEFEISKDLIERLLNKDKSE